MKWLYRGWRSTYRPNMKNNNLIRFAQSLVLLPIMTVSLSVGSIGSMANNQTSQDVLAQKVNIEAKATLTLDQRVDAEADLKE